MYNWQNQNWPHFVYDLTSCQSILYNYIKEMSRLSGALSQLSLETLVDAKIEIMVTEALKTSEIEGEFLDEEDVRSSIRLNLKLPSVQQKIADHRAMGIAQLMVEMRSTYAKPLTREMLKQWHQMVMMDHETDKVGMIGCYRSNKEPMQIVSGPIGRERVYFEAPPSERLDHEMDVFIEWFNKTQPQEGQEDRVSGPVRAAIAHLYFESIHPFIDGNGRIGRALVEKILSQELGAPLLFSVSHSIQEHRKAYYTMLHANSGYSLEITQWIQFFVDLIFKAQRTSHEMIHFTLDKTQFWRSHANHVTTRQEKVLQRMLKEGPKGFEGGMSAQKYMKLTGCSKATATRDLADLVEKKCLYRLPGSGSATHYAVLLREREIHGS